MNSYQRSSDDRESSINRRRNSSRGSFSTMQTSSDALLEPEKTKEKKGKKEKKEKKEKKQKKEKNKKIKKQKMYQDEYEEKEKEMNNHSSDHRSYNHHNDDQFPIKISIQIVSDEIQCTITPHNVSSSNLQNNNNNNLIHIKIVKPNLYIMQRETTALIQEETKNKTEIDAHSSSSSVSNNKE